MAKPGSYTVQEVQAMLSRGKGKVRNVAPRAARTYNGRVYHSKAEALQAFELDRLKAAGKIYMWEAQPRLPIIWPGGPVICVVVLDFCILDSPAKAIQKRYVEIKGWESEIWKLKKKLLLACYPGINLQVVKV